MKSGQKLLDYLRQRAPKDVSVKAIKRALDAGRCTVNGKMERISTRLLKKGDQVHFDFPEEKSSQLPPITILYEDGDLLICDKPPRMISENRVFNQRFPQYQGKLELVHRLDKDTTGVIILAKNPKMRGAMEDLFAKRVIRKFYLAIVHGNIPQKEGKIDNFLAKKKGSPDQISWESVPAGRGKRAVTLWQCLKTGLDCSLLHLEPLTGRTHQLRVHLSEWGHPIIGDAQYAKHPHSLLRPSMRPSRQLLHAFKIIFYHPLEGKEIEIEAPLPADFLESLKKLKLV